jgi:hypothetical protein
MVPEARHGTAEESLMQRQSTGQMAEAFVGALREVMLEDLLEAEEDVLGGIEGVDEVLLLDACSRLYAAAWGYTQVLHIDYPVSGNLWPELEELAYHLGEYLHESGRWADPEVVDDMVGAIFCSEPDWENDVDAA